MADEIDQANERAAQDTALALAVRKPVGPEANGACHWCEEALSDGRRWCNSECRDMHQRYGSAP